jgi:hypothetical protein
MNGMPANQSELLDESIMADLVAIARLRDITMPALVKEIMSGYLTTIKKVIGSN